MSVASALLVDHMGAIMTVRLNRPDSRNALSQELHHEFAAAIGEFDSDASVRAIILTGTDPAFCSGVGFKELDDSESATETIGPRYSPIVHTTTPLIGAINGAAYAGGLELALACHLLVA